MRVDAREALFEPVGTRRATDDIVQQVVAAIEDGDLAVGSVLPSERTLAIQLQVSRPTLREAVRVLCEHGVLRVSTGRGGGIQVVSDAIPPALSQPVEISPADVGHVLDARRLLEPRVAQLAALYATDQDLEILEAVVAAQKAAVDTPDRFEQLELQFHLAMARSAHNPTVIRLMRVLLRDLRGARAVILREEHDRTWAIEVHQRTLASIRTGDADAIERVMSHHLSLLEAIWEEVTGRPRLRKPPGFLLA